MISFLVPLFISLFAYHCTHRKIRKRSHCACASICCHCAIPRNRVHESYARCACVCLSHRGAVRSRFDAAHTHTAGPLCASHWPNSSDRTFEWRCFRIFSIFFLFRTADTAVLLVVEHAPVENARTKKSLHIFLSFHTHGSSL